MEVTQTDLLRLARQINDMELSVTGVIPDELSDLLDDSKHRLVTDAEKAAWNEKRYRHGVQLIGAVTFDNSTHILSIATITYWYKGVSYTSATPITCDLDSYETLTTNKLYYFYFEDAAGVLKCSDTDWDFFQTVPIATMYWNGTAGALNKEWHGSSRNLDWHRWAHNTIGARYRSGLTLTYPDSSHDASLQIETGMVYDEDLYLTTGQQTSMRGWYKADVSHYTWTVYALPYLGTSGAPVFLDTDTYALATFLAARYACYWVYATTDADYPIQVIPTHATDAYNTVAQARAEEPPNLAGFGLSPEWKLIYRFIYSGNGQFQEAEDFRIQTSLPGGTPTSTNAGSVLFAPTGDIAATTVQAAIEELDIEKIPIANVKSYGAVGDGTTDDTAAIQAAINAKTHVYLPEGSYRITSPLVIQNTLNLFGANRFDSKIITDGCDGLTADGKYYFNLHDFSIHGINTGATLNKGIELKGSSARFVLSNINIQYCDVALDLYSVYLGEYYSLFLNYNNICVKMDGPSSGYGCHAASFFGGEFVNSNIGIWAKYGSGIKFYGTTIEFQAQYGVYFETGNELYNFELETIYFEANAVDIQGSSIMFVRIKNCFLTSIGKPAGTAYFIKADNLLRTSVTDCIFSATADNHFDLITPGSSPLVYDFTFFGNQVIGNNPVSFDTAFTDSLVTHPENIYYNKTTGYSCIGVTNGNSHDHSGGDGAQIAYSTLSGTPDLTNYVAKSLYDANTVLYATSDNTPAALTVTEQTVVGRATGGAIAAISIDSDLSSVSANDDTVPSAKAAKAYSDTKIAKTTNITSLNETGIADGEVAVFNLTNKDIRTSNVTIATTLGADDTTLPTSKAVKTVTDALVTKATYDANTVLAATTDNTPAAVTITEQTVLGRATGGNIAALAIDSDLSAVSVNDDTVPSAKATKTALDLKVIAPATNTADYIPQWNGANSKTLKDGVPIVSSTWTPAVGGSTGDGTVAYTVQYGFYYQIGKLVHIDCSITLGTVTSAPTGYLRISGHPNAKTTTGYAALGHGYTSGVNWGTSMTMIVPRLAGDQPGYIYFYTAGNNAASNVVGGADIATGDIIRFSMTYQID